jgi:hypothetical protein
MQAKNPHNAHAPLKALLTPYCFGDATEDERRAFEVHLIECNDCWSEVRRLDSAIQTLRTDRSLFRRLVTGSTFGFFGLSGAVGRPFGGHFWHALLSCLLYALLYAISLLFETMQFGRLHPLTWWVAGALVLPWMFASALLALLVDWRLTIQGRTSGFFAGIGIFVLGVIVLLTGTSFFFPQWPTGNIDLHAYPPQIAYIKDVTYYYLPFALAFLLLPFHFTVAVQEDVRSGRHRSMFALLTGDKAAVCPRGAAFPKVWLLSLVLAALALYFSVLTNVLFDRLNRGADTSSFMFLIQLKNLALVALGVECLIWYSRSLDELKRECVAVLRDLG